MDRLPSERVVLALEGPSVEVERLRAWPLYWTALRLLSAYYAAMERREPEAEFAALVPLYEAFVAEAQPSWAIADHRGPIPVSLLGMCRFDVLHAIAMVQGWLETFARQPEAATAADDVLPDGELRDAVNAALREKRTTSDAE